MRLTFAPTSSRSVIGLPNWIPGSYKIRDFAKNIITVSATADSNEVDCVALDKHRWVIHAQAKKIVVTYSVYAKDISVRTAYCDDQLFFFNPSSLCMYIEGLELAPCTLTIAPSKLKACKEWHCDTALLAKKTDAKGFGTFAAQDYDELIDHPFLIGPLKTIAFKAHGIPHRMSIVGAPRADLERLTHDLKKICEAQITFFGKSPVKKAYVFLTWVMMHGYGGLEHRSSTALMTSRESMPYDGMPKEYAPYADFLSLCSHEYFHTWHVKRTKPEAFMPYDLSEENYTRQLWIFEGFTSYYEDIFLERAGLITKEQYLMMFAQKITQVERNPGHLVQSVSDSSHSAWTKFYDPNENSPNVTVSYYAKGALIAWGLDVMLRRGEKHTLDDVVRHLWETYGATATGVPEGTVEKIILEWGGKKLAKALDVWVNGVEPLPLIAWAKASGWTLTYVSDHPECAVDLGVRVSGDGRNTVAVCLDGGAAQLAGISAGDELVACGGVAIRQQPLSELLRRYKVSDTVKFHIFRQDLLHEYVVVLQAGKHLKAKLE
jgi:predicted metalloprotease with PDZ domain